MIIIHIVGMSSIRFILLIIIFSIPSLLLGQQFTVEGSIVDEDNKPITDVSVYVENTASGTVSDKLGNYSLRVNVPNLIISFKHLAYHSETKKVVLVQDAPHVLDVILRRKTEYLESVEVTGISEQFRVQAGITVLVPKAAELLPGPFNDFSKILATLPGVTSNNELSSTYSVRGGNFDENLIYVNDIPIYRPQLITSGRQEGLGFVNTSLVDNITFSAGGWQAQYGDKMSSSLNIDYKEPDEFAASATLGLLGGDAHIENSGLDGRLNYIVGVRHKSSQYLLNSLETKGEYLPRFTDVQSYVNYNLGPKDDLSRTKLGVLMGYARNRYQVRPESKETEFGSFTQSFRLFIAFDGQEQMQYDTYQGGLKLTHEVNSQFTTNLIVSGVKSIEREYRDLEGAYRLCDLDNDTRSNSFNECVVTRGIGSNYQYSRNNLTTEMIHLESKNQVELNMNNTLEFGVGYDLQLFDDVLDEYEFRDSSDYIINLVTIQQEQKLENNLVTGYLQNTTRLSANSTLNVGMRVAYTDRNNQVLLSPRVQYSFRPIGWSRDVVFKAAVGVYQQPAFYRELRHIDGSLLPKTEAQKSIHYIVGMDQNMKLWGRNFKFTSELYYKSMSRIIPYDVDNVRIRYYAATEGKAYAAGIDMRFSGEFIPGTVSWFSLGILSTKEDVVSDNQGFIRRPSDQQINLGIFFQDYLPSNPSWRVNLSLLVGSGLPFGPPGDINSRNTYTGDLYRRVDVGFTKEIELGSKDNGRTILLSAEILNMLGALNSISYTWIEDVVGQTFAVPNSLSARFLNLKVKISI